MTLPRAFLAAVVVSLLCGACGGDDRSAAEEAVESAMKDAPGAFGAGSTDAEEGNDVAEWSHDHADVVFVSNREGTADIFFNRGADTTWTPLTEGAAVNHHPSWSPDGSRIVFQRAVVIEGEADLRKEDTFDIYVMNADGSGVERLTDDPAADILPSWSPDGTKITFTSWRQEAVDSVPDADEKVTKRRVPKPHVYIMNADGSDPRRFIADSPGTETRVSWAPDGEALALARREGKRGADIYIASSAGIVIRRLTRDDAANGAPVFSPGGRYVAYHADHGDRSEIVVADRWALERRVVVAEGTNRYPRWSPDGRWILFAAAAGDGNLDVHAVPVDGGNSVIVAGGPARETEGEWRPRR